MAPTAYSDLKESPHCEGFFLSGAQQLHADSVILMKTDEAVMMGANNVRGNTSDFIEASRKVHGENYDYSKTEYVNAKIKVEIICNEHGSFMQSPNKHTSMRQGCPACSRLRQRRPKISADEVVKRATKKHGNKYEYDISSYKLTTSPMRIKCKKHGWFEQIPEHHIKSDSGCSKCSIEKISQEKSYDTGAFIKKAIIAHGDRYSYDCTEFKRSGIKVKVRCMEHGVFEQIAANHINGYGCPSCAKNGFNVNAGAHLYVLESKCKSMIKVGVTKNIRQRIMSLTSYTPFEFDLVAHYSGKGRHVKDEEGKYHQELMSCELSGFSGASEWFRYDHDVVERIKKRAEALF